MELTHWRELQPGLRGRKIRTEMIDGYQVDISSRLVGQMREPRRIRRVLFDRDYCFKQLDIFFSEMTKEEASNLVKLWLENG
jgi:hypothetical protein